MNDGPKANGKQKFAVFDLDGTLCDLTHRLPHIKKDEPDWDAFFDACVNDTPKPDIIALARAVKNNVAPYYDELVILSGRSDRVRQKTIDWLTLYSIDYDHLIMREEGDHRPDHELKEQILINTLGVDNVRYAVDDRQQVVDMWRRNGVTCLQCAPGDF